MSDINFRKTGKSYSVDYQRNNGCGFERRFYRIEDVNNCAKDHGWSSADDQVHGEEWTVAEMFITCQVVQPYRVTDV